MSVPTQTSASNHDPAKAMVDMILSATSLLPPSRVPPTVQDCVVDAVVPRSSQQDDPNVKMTLDSVSVSTVLSPFAKVWVPTSNTIVKNLDILYPPGKNTKGVEFDISDDAWVALELGNKSSFDFELPADAAYDIPKNTRLLESKVALPNGSIFLDKILPQLPVEVVESYTFPPEYFIDLHNKVRQSGTYNYAGARLELKHSKLNIECFRQFLEDYDDIVICQFLQFGFPLGLSEEIFLEPALKNHQSSYLYYTYVDKFIQKEVTQHGVSGPLSVPPFSPTMLSPIMTSPKNPSSRRPVFDASWGDWSINENTPTKSYLGGNYEFRFPSVLDFGDMIVKQGRGCLIWKRDLSRWFLQLPVDPADFDKLGFVWRGQFWWFVSFVWGCRHAGYCGHRVASAVLYILKKMGINTENTEEFLAIVYMDDFAGCITGQRAFDAFNSLGKLLHKLGIKESADKAQEPSTRMKFLGVEFDTIDMSMKIDDKKLQEITALTKKWSRKTVATKEELQSILGKVLWVSKVVRFSRCFVSRIIALLKGLRTQKQKVTLTENVKKDFLWWSEFLPVFNGVELLVPSTVFCSVLGDATLQGGGSWNEREKEYFSRRFPPHLQDHNIFIHLKEFFIAIVAAKLWGHLGEGRRVAIYCDNKAVMKTMIYQKPQDPELQKCLREMLYHACRFKFQPVFLRVTTDDNDIADFISRIHDQEAIKIKFEKRGLTNMKAIEVPDDTFNFVADW